MPLATQQFFRTIDLTDTAISNPQDGEVLAYQASSGNWVNATPAAGGSSTLSGLNDVTISSVADGEILVYDSGNWINQTLAEAGVAAASHTHAASDIVSGELNDDRLSSNVALYDQAGGFTQFIQFDDFNISGSGGRTGITSSATAGRTVSIADLDGELVVLTDLTPASSEFLVRNGSGGYDSRLLVEADISDLGTYLEDLSSLDTGDLAEGSNLYFTNERVDDRVNALLVAGSNISLTYNDGAGTLTIDATASGGSSTLSGLDDVTLTSLSDGEILVYDSGSSDWINQTLAEAGIASASHTHATTDIVSGTFADARIAQSNVTQHEASLTITESQISDLGTYYESGDTILASDGTLANPGLSFANHDNFGLYMQSSSRMDLVANGTSITRLSNNGIFSTAIFQAEVTQFVASISWVASSTNSIFNNTTTSAGAKITLREGSANGVSGISFTAPNSLASNVTFEVPAVDGSAGQTLQTDGSGVLSFADTEDKLIQIDWTHEQPTNDSYVICRKLPARSGSLNSIAYATDSGSCTINVTIDGTSVTSWSSLSVTSTEGTTASTGNETFSGGETLRIVVSSNSSADMLSISIAGEFD